MCGPEQSARFGRMGWPFLAFTAVCASSCGNGRTALGTINRDAQGDLSADKTDGSPSRADLRAPGEGVDPGASGGRAHGGTGGAGAGGSGGAGGAGFGGAGYAGAGGVGRGGVAGGPSGGTAGTIRGGTSGQSGRGGAATGGATGGAAGTNGVAGSSGRGGVAGVAGGIATGGAAGAIRDGGAVDLRDAGPEMGTDGPVRWRNSANSLCVPTSVGSGSAGVYSNGSELFVMAWNASGLKPTVERPATVWANDGSGWRTYFAWSKDAQFPTRFYGGNRAGIRGRTDGSLFAFGRYGCAIELVDQVGEHCSGALPSVADLFVSVGNTAYATDGYYLLKYDGSLWTQVGGRLPLGDAAMVQGYALWADESTVVVGGSNGYVVTIYDEKTVTVLPKPAEAHNITGVWSFGANDLWVATEGGDLHHYDGSSWTLKWTPPTYAGGGARLWGVEGHLFVVGYGQFAEWDGSGLRSLLPSGKSDRQFTDVWGTSATEVFATSVATSDEQIGSCDAVELWWYDGTTARTM